MGDSHWIGRAALAGAHGVSTTAQGAAAGVRLVEQPLGGSLLVVSRRGKSDSVGDIVQRELRLALPTKPRRVAGGTAEVLWSGPGQWLVMDHGAGGPERLAKLSLALAGVAASIDQSDARVVLRLSGPQARRVLMKLIGIDVHPSAFAVDDVAMTPIAHIAGHVWRRADVDGAPEFDIAGPRSMAGNLWHAVVAASSEYGLDARPLQPAIEK